MWRCRGEFLCRTAPEKEGAGPVGEPRDDLPRQAAPTQIGMPLCHALRDRQGGVQKQDALIGPVRQVGAFARYVQVGAQLFENISKTVQPTAKSFRYRKRESVSFAEAMIRILTQDYHAACVRLSALQRCEHPVRRRQDVPILARKGGTYPWPVRRPERQIRPTSQPCRNHAPDVMRATVSTVCRAFPLSMLSDAISTPCDRSVAFSATTSAAAAFSSVASR